jgi:putative redox protein
MAEERKQGLAQASVAWEDGMSFLGESEGQSVRLDADSAVGGMGDGMRPMTLLLLGVAGCTAMDVISILRKKRQNVTGLRVEARGRQADEHPRVFEEVDLIYEVRGTSVDPKAVERAIELSEDRYCPAIATVRGTAEIRSRYEIVEEG